MRTVIASNTQAVARRDISWRDKKDAHRHCEQNPGGSTSRSLTASPFVKKPFWYWYLVLVLVLVSVLVFGIGIGI